MSMSMDQSSPTSIAPHLVSQHLMPQQSPNDALQQAIDKGNVLAVKLLLQQMNFDINALNPITGETALIHAVKRKNPDIVALLLSRQDIDVNKLSGVDEVYPPPGDFYLKPGATPLVHACCSYYHPDILKLLLNHPKIDVNQTNKNKETVLMLALSHHFFSSAQTLLSRADIKINMQDVVGQTALHRTCPQGYFDTFRPYPLNIVSLVVNYNQLDVNIADVNGETALFHAAQIGDSAMVNLLLQKKDIDVNIANNDGWTPLYSATLYSETDCVKLLLEKSCSIDCNIATKKDNHTCFWKAAESGQTEIVTLFLKHICAKESCSELDETTKSERGCF